jgi:hypothetical protein
MENGGLKPAVNMLIVCLPPVNARYHVPEMYIRAINESKNTVIATLREILSKTESKNATPKAMIKI